MGTRKRSTVWAVGQPRRRRFWKRRRPRIEKGSTPVGQTALEPLQSRVFLSGVHFVHTTAALSQARGIAGAATVGDLAIFAGGFVDTGDNVSDVVDIYDDRTARWSTATLSTARYQIAATTVRGKALFAGGNTGIIPTDAVDIYDSVTGAWSTAKLSQGNTPSAAVTVGNKALFVGGQTLPTSRVEIYDGKRGRWSTTDLSQARDYPVGTAVGMKALFAGGSLAGGGFSDLVDIYDGTSGRWSTMKLPVAAQFDVATTVGSKAIFAGGTVIRKDGEQSYGSDLVEIFDTRTGSWSMARLSQGRGQLSAVSVGNAAFFAGGRYDDADGGHASNVVDIYDAETGRWSTTSLEQPRASVAGTAIGDAAIFAGGLDPAAFSDSVRATVDLFTLDNTAPTPQRIAAPILDHSTRSYTFTVSYHDRHGLDRGTFDDNDVFVTGPNGFNHAARFVSETRGKHASTRVVTYAVRGRGLRWDAGENGLYTIRLHGNQVTDTAGNAAQGDDLGEFTVAIPAAQSPSAGPVSVVTAFHSKREVEDWLQG